MADETDPVADLKERSQASVPADAGEKPSVLPSAPKAEVFDDDTDEEAEDGQDVGLEYLYDNEELAEEEQGDEDFDDPGNPGDDDYEIDDDDDEEEGDTSLADAPSKRKRDDDEDDEPPAQKSKTSKADENEE